MAQGREVALDASKRAIVAQLAALRLMAEMVQSAEAVSSGTGDAIETRIAWGSGRDHATEGTETRRKVHGLTRPCRLRDGVDTSASRGLIDYECRIIQGNLERSHDRLRAIDWVESSLHCGATPLHVV